MKSIQICTLILGLSFPKLIWAFGNEVNNGGSVISCRDINSVNLEKIKTIENFENQFAVSAEIQSLGGSYLEIIDFVLLRFQHLDVLRAQKYRLILADILSKTNWLNEAMAPLPDLGVVSLPENCQIYTAAVIVRSDEKISYNFSKSIFAKLDNLNKASLILHEIIYTEAIQPEHAVQNASAIRTMNQFLFSDEILKISLQSYHQFILSEVGLKTATAGDATEISLATFIQNGLRLNPISYYNADVVEHAMLGPRVCIGKGCVLYTARNLMVHDDKTHFVDFNLNGTKRKLVLGEFIIFDNQANIIQFQFNNKNGFHGSAFGSQFLWDGTGENLIYAESYANDLNSKQILKYDYLNPLGQRITGDWDTIKAAKFHFQ